MTTKEKIEVMQAYADGKKVQIKERNSSNWRDYGNILAPEWNWGDYDYRIKLEPTYRPYKDTDEMIEDYKKRARIVTYDLCRPLIWIKSCDEFVSLITEFGIGCVWRSVCQDSISMKDLLLGYTYLDGSPCGMKEE